MGVLTKNSSEKSNAPHIPGVPSLRLNIDRSIICTHIHTCFKQKVTKLDEIVKSKIGVLAASNNRGS